LATVHVVMGIRVTRSSRPSPPREPRHGSRRGQMR
jgi:hypothetical protein